MCAIKRECESNVSVLIRIVVFSRKPNFGTDQAVGKIIFEQRRNEEGNEEKKEIGRMGGQ